MQTVLDFVFYSRIMGIVRYAKYLFGKISFGRENLYIIWRLVFGKSFTKKYITLLWAYSNLLIE